MKKELFDLMLSVMEKNENVYFIFVGLGYPRYDEFKEKWPDRVINTEAAEQTALDIAVGLSYAGKLPVVYTIASFYWRAAETLRTYINHENLPCILIGAGVGDEYSKEDGFSHSAEDMPELFGLMDNFHQFYPDRNEQLKQMLTVAINLDAPAFINIHR